MKYNQKLSSTLLLVFAFILLSVIFLQPSTKKYVENSLTVSVGPEFNRELNCLAENVYYEAGNESYEGKLAVAQVTINRTNSSKFPASICEVVKQRNVINGSIVCQFSWACNKLDTSVRNKYEWDEAALVARKALTEPFVHDTMYKNNALYYHASYINPGWNLTRITSIGKHIFYKEKI
jgi:spore germination cell wall hydrolase CwlJ-like protein